MKFEQAMRAMRRGEKVLRKGWTRGRGLYMSSASCAMMIPESDLFADDWVILRKKKKEPALRDVFKDPRVGDVIGNSSGTSFWMALKVTPDKVKWVGHQGITATETRGEWASAAAGLTVIHRAK